jgi:hypothetical protein
MSVSRARFEQKGGEYVAKQDARQKRAKKKVLQKLEKDLGWAGFDDVLKPQQVGARAGKGKRGAARLGGWGSRVVGRYGVRHSVLLFIPAWLWMVRGGELLGSFGVPGVPGCRGCQGAGAALPLSSACACAPRAGAAAPVLVA